jgi:hypothetical protein
MPSSIDYYIAAQERLAKWRKTLPLKIYLNLATEEPYRNDAEGENIPINNQKPSK